MASFDAEVWYERARARYRKKQLTAKNKAHAVKRLEQDRIHIDALDAIMKWCSGRGINVTFCRRQGGMYYPENKQIQINGRLLPERQVFFLLHECGHHLIGDKEKHERFGMGHSQEDPDLRRTFQHRCDILDEEFEAWHRGFKLAQRLKLKINKERFDCVKVEMLKTYIKWVAAPGTYIKDDEEIMA
jgi:hypothetical protein